jgi:protein-disulfide isomerase
MVNLGEEYNLQCTYCNLTLPEIKLHTTLF